MEQESKSISQSELLSAYDVKCSHCALTKFANLWQEYQNADTAALLEGLLELLSDVLVTIPDKDFQDQVIIAATVRLHRDFTDIVNSTYKPDQLASLRAKTEGRLQ